MQAVVDLINARLCEHAAAQRGQRMLFVDCSTSFLDPAAPGGWEVDRRLIPDGIHPTRPRGAARGGGWPLAACVRGALQEALGAEGADAVR